MHDGREELLNLLNRKLKILDAINDVYDFTARMIRSYEAYVCTVCPIKEIPEMKRRATEIICRSVIDMHNLAHDRAECRRLISMLESEGEED
jgi:hypothetical protein